MHLRHWNKEALTIHRHHLIHSTHLCHAYANKRNKVLATKKVAINTIWSVSTYRFPWITQSRFQLWSKISNAHIVDPIVALFHNLAATTTLYPFTLISIENVPLGVCVELEAK